MNFTGPRVLSIFKHFFFLFQFPDIYIPKRDLLEVEEVETYALKNAETHRTEKYELVRNSQVHSIYIMKVSSQSQSKYPVLH